MADGKVVFDILADASQFQSTVSRLTSSVSRAVGAVGGAMTSAGDAMTAAVTLPLSAGAVAAAKWASDVVGAAEQADIALSTMLGPERAKAMLEDLADFARTTPFEMSGLTSATQKLLAYGFAAEDVIPMLTSVGDASAALGAGEQGVDSLVRALGQLQAKGKASAEEMLQLTEVGVPAWQYLADVVSNGDIPKAMDMVTNGAVDADTAISALRAGMDRDFGGLMAEQAGTLQGVLSNLTDGIEGAVRSLKDTQGWEDTTAALSRLAEVAGPLVERALPLLDDGLQRVAEVVEDASYALDDLDTDDLAGLADAAIKIAGAGPALSVAGRGLTLVSKGAGLLSSASGAASKATGRLSDGLMDLATSPKTADGALGKLASTILSIPTPAAALAGVAGGLLVTAIGALAAEAAEAAAHEELLEGATKSAADIMGDAASSADGLGDAIGGIEPDVQGTLEAMRDLNESVEETLSEVAVDSARLDQYVATIDQLANSSGLSATEQYRLQEAVEGYNRITGEQWQVVDAVNGKIADQSGVVQENTDQLHANADAWKSRARAEALSSVAADYMEQEARSAYELQVAQDNLNEAYQRREDLTSRYNELTDNGKNPLAEGAYDLASQIESLNREIPGLEQNVSDLGAAHEAVARNAEDFANMAALETAVFSTLGDRSGDFVEALSQSGISLADFAALSDEQLAAIASAWDGTAEGIGAAITNAGVSVGSFSGILAAATPEVQASAAMMAQAMGTSLSQLESDLAGAGVSAEQMGAVSSEAFAGMVARCGGDITTLAWMIQNYNSVPVADKSGTITINDAQLRDAEGNVYSWNGSELVDQNGVAAVDDVELMDAQGNLYTWNDSKLENKSAVATVDTSGLQSGIDLLNAWNSMRAESKTATFTTTNRTINVVENQTVQSSRMAPARAQAAPAAAMLMAVSPAAPASAEPAQAAPAAPPTGAMLASLMSVPLPAASEAITAAVAASVQTARWSASERRSRERDEASDRRQERMVARVERACERVERALTSPVELRTTNKRELGRLVKEVS